MRHEMGRVTVLGTPVDHGCPSNAWPGTPARRTMGHQTMIEMLESTARCPMPSGPVRCAETQHRARVAYGARVVRRRAAKPASRS